MLNGSWLKALPQGSRLMAHGRENFERALRHEPSTINNRLINELLNFSLFLISKVSEFQTHRFLSYQDFRKSNSRTFFSESKFTKTMERLFANISDISRFPKIIFPKNEFRMFFMFLKSFYRNEGAKVENNGRRRVH